MTEQQARNAILAYHWEPWINREFGAFVLSLFRSSVTLRHAREIGVPVRYPCFVFQGHQWYESHEMHLRYGAQVARLLSRRKLRIAFLSQQCLAFRKRNIRRIEKLIGDTSIPIHELLAELDDIFGSTFAFVWPAHGLDAHYTALLRTHAARYATTDIDTYIGDLTAPTKKNAHTLLEEALRGSRSLTAIQRQYGWLKARNVLSPGFTIAELASERKRLRSHPAQRSRSVVVPRPLRAHIAEARELVYFRTLRTEAFYELLFRAEPLFRRICAHFHIPPERLTECALQDLMQSTVKYYPNPNIICVDGFEFFLKKPIINATISTAETVKGTIAYPGIVTGRVVVVTTTAELPKVKKGDVLVTQMTFPSFIIAMQKASAFVTDEGGLTCHAAIVAREMKKPCIVGTKHATASFKDGDIVEVDANNGVVRKL